ncbi:MAG TPA: metallophosphoesterase family protein, partial [Aggregatilineales bacterium]|nr:metallophosphoesterase family protein [Aggregatilineales bacterium]
MKLIAIPDLHSRYHLLERMADELAAVDMVLLVGDITNGSSKDAQETITTLRQWNANILAIPGNMDTRHIVDYLDAEGIGIHAGHRIIDGIAFVGIGGALPFAGPFVYEEDEFMTLFREVSTNLDKSLPQILVCHQPPKNTQNDLLPGGVHVGSTAVREYIEMYQPMICFTGHIHEATGMDKIGKTQIVNPGPLARGGYAYAEVSSAGVEKLEIH